MFRYHLSGQCLFVHLDVGLAPQSEYAEIRTPEAEIRSIVAGRPSCVGRRRRHPLRAVMWRQSDASFTNLFGMVMYGADDFAKRHNVILSTFYKGTSKKHVIRRIRFITPDVAIVDIDNEVHGVKTMPGGIAVPPGGVLKTQLMEVFVRRGDRWWIEAYHNVDLKPANEITP